MDHCTFATQMAIVYNRTGSIHLNLVGINKHYMSWHLMCKYIGRWLGLELSSFALPAISQATDVNVALNYHFNMS